jgi:hypothetical protein
VLDCLRITSRIKYWLVCTDDAKQTASSSVRATVTDNDSGTVSYKTWDHAEGPYYEWHVGEEWTCTSGEIDGVKVTGSEYRRNSDHTWVSATADSPYYNYPGGDSQGWNGYGKWCSTLRTFVYWYRDPSPPAC